MYCKNCGKEVEDGSCFCPHCGTRLDDSSVQGTINNIHDKVDDISKTLDSQLDSAIKDVNKSVSGNSYDSHTLSTSRSLVGYIILSLISCGIYGYYFIYTLARDINVACANDGDRTPGLATYIILSFITCGFYSLYWEYKLANRIYANQQRYNITIAENGTAVLLWRIFGALICLLGTFVGINILINNTNKICQAYNDSHL